MPRKKKSYDRTKYAHRRPVYTPEDVVIRDHLADENAAEEDKDELIRRGLESPELVAARQRQDADRRPAAVELYEWGSGIRRNGFGVEGR